MTDRLPVVGMSQRQPCFEGAAELAAREAEDGLDFGRHSTRSFASVHSHVPACADSKRRAKPLLAEMESACELLLLGDDERQPVPFGLGPSFARSSAVTSL